MKRRGKRKTVRTARAEIREEKKRRNVDKIPIVASTRGKPNGDVKKRKTTDNKLQETLR